MHASIWKFNGDPDRLLRGYDEVVTEIPSAAMRLQLCLRAPDGILLVDTCPTEEKAEAVVADPDFRRLLADHGLPAPEPVTLFPVHRAFVEGQAVETDGAR
jgi:hypothetical protein